MEKINLLSSSLCEFLGNPLDLEWRQVEIDGHKISVPASWSDTAARILATKYMRKDGVPQKAEPNIEAVEEYDPEGKMPAWLWPLKPDDHVLTGPEVTAHQVFHRIAGHWTFAAWIYGYINTEQDAVKLYRAAYMGLAKQVFAPNSPQWFNTGVWWAYGVKGSSINHYCTSKYGALPVENEAYKWPQTSACFMLGVEDNLLDKDGIFETLHREAQIFKYGSGAGANFSKLRHKRAPLSSGGESSGLLSFLKVLDTAAGAIKSGGTTRRAAKMVVVNADHPDAEDFAHVKAREEMKIRVLQEGARAAIKAHAYDDRLETDLENLIGDWESGAHDTVGFQNANHSIRFTDQQMDVIRRAKTGMEPQTEEEQALLNVWREMCRAAWECADPGFSARQRPLVARLRAPSAGLQPALAHPQCHRRRDARVPGLDRGHVDPGRPRSP